MLAIVCLLLFSTACPQYTSPPEQGIYFQIDHADKGERAEAQLQGVVCSKAHDNSVTDLGMELGHFLF